MKIKKNVKLAGVVPQMLFVIPVVDEASLNCLGEEPAKNDWGCVITCGTEGKHMQGSAHHTGRALDFRTRHLDPNLLDLFREEVAAALSDEYDVVLEEDHLHVEWDPKTGVNQ